MLGEVSVLLKRLGTENEIKCQKVCFNLHGPKTLYMMPKGHEIELNPFEWSVPERFKHLKFTENFPRTNKVQVDILLGVDLIGSVLTGRMKKHQNMLLIETTFGWIVAGGNGDSNEDTATSNTINANVNQTSIEEIKGGFLRLFSIERMDQDDMRESYEDLQAAKAMRDTISYDKDKGYSIGIPWRCWPRRPIVNDNNYQTCVARFLALERKLAKIKDGAKKYAEAIDTLIADKVVEIVKDIPDAKSTAFFLPHRFVAKKGSELYRIVHDASAKNRDNISLNDLQFKGSNYFNEIFDIFVRQRFYKWVAFVDVKGMFLGINLLPIDSALCSMLWRYPGSNEPFQWLKFNRVLFGMASSPALASFVQLTALETVVDNCNNEFTEFDRHVAAEAIKNVYVDDHALCGRNPELLLKKAKSLVKIMQILPKFKLAKFWHREYHSVLNLIHTQNSHFLQP